MSEKPVAWMTNEDSPRVASDWSRNGMFATAKESYCIPLYSQSPAEARALAIAECAKLLKDGRLEKGFSTSSDWEDGYNDGISDSVDRIRALSSPPSVTQAQVDAIWETVRDKSKECDDPSEAAMWGIRATLAALGITVEGAAK